MDNTPSIPIFNPHLNSNISLSIFEFSGKENFIRMSNIFNTSSGHSHLKVQTTGILIIYKNKLSGIFPLSTNHIT